MSKSSFCLFIFLLYSHSLLAHGSHGSGIMAGLTHPIFGLDHLLAISCLGLFIATLNDRKHWLIALAFTITMAISGWMGIATEGFTYMETGIAVSVVLLGVLLASNSKVTVLIGIIASIVIAFFHGYAHGVEMPESSSAFVYISGYTLGVILIFAISIGIGRLINNSINQSTAKNIFKVLGVIYSLFGLYIVFG